MSCLSSVLIPWDHFLVLYSAYLAANVVASGASSAAVPPGSRPQCQEQEPRQNEQQAIRLMAPGRLDQQVRPIKIPAQRQYPKAPQLDCRLTAGASTHDMRAAV